VITPLRKTSDYLLWLLLFFVVIAIGYQWDWHDLLPSQSSSQSSVMNVESLSSPTSASTLNTAPFLTVKLSSQQLTITEQRQYVIGIEATSNITQPLHWRYQAPEGISVTLKTNQLLLTIDEINFKQSALTLSFYNDEVNVDETVTLINTRQFIEEDVDDYTAQSAHNNIISSQLTGIIEFDRLTFIESTDNNITSYRFDPDYPQQHPLRFMRLNLRNLDNEIVARTYTDESGHYQFDINSYEHSADYYLEVVSQMQITSPGDQQSFTQVINQGQDYADRTTYQRLYHATSSAFNLLSGDNQQDLRIKTGWHHTQREFLPQDSAAQPFAILDTLAKGILYLHDNDIDLPSSQEVLTVHWSQDPDIIEESTGYYNSAQNVIYISGNNAQDTTQKPISTISEWNEHTILHEFGHFYLKKIVGRDDTQAGRHTAFGFGSLPLSLSEGLANTLAKVILKDWQYKRVNADIDKKREVINAQAIARNDTNNAQRYLTTQQGKVYQRPYIDFSPFIEETISYFLLSIIDPRSEYSARTSKLHNEIGMKGLHQALLSSAQSSSLLTIYSLAQTLKQQTPSQRFAIDELGAQLELNLNDQWGSQQSPLASHIIGRNDKLLPEVVQYPFYLPAYIGQSNDISFNGALQSMSAKRPGTVRYLTFTAPKDGRIVLKIAHLIDDDNNTHKFSFNVVQRGNVITRHRYSEENEFTYSVFTAQQDQIYIIRVFDELFNDSAIKSEETVTAKLVIGYR